MCGFKHDGDKIWQEIKKMIIRGNYLAQKQVIHVRTQEKALKFFIEFRVLLMVLESRNRKKFLCKRIYTSIMELVKKKCHVSIL
jgi:hypothetical protein